MLKKILHTILTFRIQTAVLIFCILSVSVSLFFIISKFQQSVISGETFEEALLNQGIKEIYFSSDTDLISFDSYQNSSKLWNNIFQLSFDPPVSGTIRTISGNKFSYVFNQPFPPNKTLKISYNTNILFHNNKTNKIFINYQESTNSPFILEGQKPKITYSSRESNNLTNPIHLYANIPILLKDVKKGLKISKNNRNIFYTLSYQVSTNYELNSKIAFTNYKHIVVMPLNFTPNSTYQITIDHNKFSSKNASDYIFEKTFSTYPPAELYNICSSQFPIDDPTEKIFTAGNPVWLLSKTPLNEKITPKSILVSDPPIDNLSYSIQPEGIKITGEFIAGKTYQLTFTPKKLIDIYRQKIVQTFSSEITISHKKPKLKQGKTVLIIPKNKALIPIQTVNVTNVKVSYQVIRSATYTAMALEGRSIPVPILTTNFSIDSNADEEKWTYFDVGNLTKNQSVLLNIYFQNADDPDNTIDFTKVIITCSTLLAHMSASDLLFYAYRIKDSSPVKDMTISIWDTSRGAFQDLGMTKADGILRIPNPKLPQKVLNSPIFIGIRSENEGDISFTGIGESLFNTIDNKIFFSSGNLLWNSSSESEIIKSMLFSNRPLYKPGETVYIHGVVRSKTNNQYISTGEFFQESVKIKILDPNHKELTNINKNWSSFGSFDIKFPLKENADSGYYSVQMENKNFDFYTQTTFKVEPFTPNTSEIIIKTDSSNYQYRDQLSLELQSRFFSGQILEIPVQYNISMTPAIYTSTKYPFHNFNDIPLMRSYNSQNFTNVLLMKGIKKPNKKSQLISLRKKLKAPFEYNAQLNISVKARPKDQAPINALDNKITVNHSIQLGMYSPTKQMPPNTEICFNLIAIDSKSEEILTNIPVEFEIIKEESLSLGIFNFLTNFLPTLTKYPKSISKTTLYLGEKTKKFIPKTPGNYTAYLSTIQNGFKTKSSLEFHVIDHIQSENSKLHVYSDKYDYLAGDQAHIFIQNPFEKSSMLLTVERDLIREFYTLESTNRTINQIIPLTSEDEPGINITVVLRSIPNNTNQISSNFISDIKIGTLEIPIKPENKKLSINIKEINSYYQPGDMVNFKINAKHQRKQIDGQAVVIIRDRAVLALSGNESIPDPISIFYSKKKNSFSTWDSGKQIYDLMAITNKIFEHYPSPLRLHHGLRISEDIGSFRSNINYTAFYEGTIVLSKDQDTSVQFKLPDNISEFDITVIAYDKHQLFGKTNSTFTTLKPLIVDPIFPEFIRIRDSFQWGAVIRNLTSNDLTIQTIFNNPFDQIITNITLESSKIQSVLYHSTATENFKTDQLWYVKGFTPLYEDGFIKDIPIIQYNPWETSSYTYLINNSTNISLNLIPDKEVISQQVFIQVSQSPVIHIKNKIQSIITNQSIYLDDIVERILSILGNEDILIQNQLVNTNKKELHKIVQKDLNTLGLYYSKTHILNNIPTDTPYKASPLTMLKTLDALLKAKQNRYSFDTKILNKLSELALKYTKNTESNNILIKAYSLNLLATEGSLDQNSFSNLYPTLLKNPEAHALILDTMHLLGYPLEIIKKTTTSLLADIQETGNIIRIPNNSAIIANTMILHYGNLSDGLKILNGLDTNNNANIKPYLSFAKINPVKEFSQISLELGNKKYKLTPTNNSLTHDINYSKDILNISINSSNTNIFYYLTYSYIPKNPPEQLYAGIEISKRILDNQKKSVKNNQLKNGNEYIIELTLKINNDSSEYVEIIDPLYGGFQPLPSEQQENNDYTYIPKIDRIHIITKSSSGIKVLYYKVTAKTIGTWTAPAVSASQIGAKEVFGYKDQPDIIIN